MASCYYRYLYRSSLFLHVLFPSGLLSLALALDGLYRISFPGDAAVYCVYAPASISCGAAYRDTLGQFLPL